MPKIWQVVGNSSKMTEEDDWLDRNLRTHMYFHYTEYIEKIYYSNCIYCVSGIGLRIRDETC